MGAFDLHCKNTLSGQRTRVPNQCSPFLSWFVLTNRCFCFVLFCFSIFICISFFPYVAATSEFSLWGSTKNLLYQNNTGKKRSTSIFGIFCSSLLWLKQRSSSTFSKPVPSFSLICLFRSDSTVLIQQRAANVTELHVKLDTRRVQRHNKPQEAYVDRYNRN